MLESGTKYFYTKIIAILFFLSLIIISSVEAIHNTRYYQQEEPIQTTQSDDKWPILTDFTQTDSYYYCQSDFIIVVIDLSILNWTMQNLTRGEVNLSVDQGHIILNYVYMDYYYEWNEFPSSIEMKANDTKHIKCAIKPNELDKNFNLFFKIRIEKNNETIYFEEHNLKIEGEPIIKVGEDFTKSNDFYTIFRIAIFIGFLIGFIIIIIYFEDHRKKLPGEK